MAAKKAHQEQERAVLSEEDSLRFVKALDANDQPNAALKSAATKYKAKKAS